MALPEQRVWTGPALVTVWADPGENVGWSVHRVPIACLLEMGQVGSVPYTWWRSGSFRAPCTSAAVDGFLALGRAAWEQAGDGDVFVMGSERFTLMMQSTDHALLEPVRFNAVLVDRLRDTEMQVESQGASDAKKTITDARLRSWGLYKAGPDHMRDAQRHGLLFLRRFASQPDLQRRHGYLGYGTA